MAEPSLLFPQEGDFPEFSAWGTILNCCAVASESSSITPACGLGVLVGVEMREGSCIEAKISGPFAEFRDLAQRGWGCHPWQT